MKLKEFMERLGRTDETKVISQMLDGVEEMHMNSEVTLKRINIDIIKGQRYYDLPHDCTRIINIQAKNQANEQGLYSKVPRLIGDVFEADADGE